MALEMESPTDLRVRNEERSIALHQAVAERLREDPGLIDRARDRVDAWLAEGLVHRVYSEAWRDLLSGPFDRLLAVLTRDDDDARTLRQCSPFAGVLDPRTRWRILREGRATE
jgi:hypothetical protein